MKVLTLVDVGLFVGVGVPEEVSEMISCGAWLADSRAARLTRVVDNGDSTRL